MVFLRNNSAQHLAKEGILKNVSPLTRALRSFKPVTLGFTSWYLALNQHSSKKIKTSGFNVRLAT